MKEKTQQRAPSTYAEFIASFENRKVRLLLSTGERREGVLIVHEDYVTFDAQDGGFPFAHIAGIVPLDPVHPAYAPVPAVRKSAVRPHRKNH